LIGKFFIMRHLPVIFLGVLSLFAALYLVIDHGTLVEQSTHVKDMDGYTYVVDYKVTRYEQKKTEANPKFNLEYPNKNQNAQPRSREFDFWNWTD